MDSYKLLSGVRKQYDNSLEKQIVDAVNHVYPNQSHLPLERRNLQGFEVHNYPESRVTFLFNKKVMFSLHISKDLAIVVELFYEGERNEKNP